MRRGVEWVLSVPGILGQANQRGRGPSARVWAGGNKGAGCSSQRAACWVRAVDKTGLNFPALFGGPIALLCCTSALSEAPSVNQNKLGQGLAWLSRWQDRKVRPRASGSSAGDGRRQRRLRLSPSEVVDEAVGYYPAVERQAGKERMGRRCSSAGWERARRSGLPRSDRGKAVLMVLAAGVGRALVLFLST